MEKKIAVVGLGYVGLPLLIEFSKLYKVVGFDINNERIKQLSKGIDETKEAENLSKYEGNILYTSDPTELKTCNYIIVTVPTPITNDKLPDLNPLISASITIGENLMPGTTVIFESTVYPGVTEEECIPVIEKNSSLKSGIDFFVGYSPERINPGDKKNNISNIIKIVSGQDEDTLIKIANLYSEIIKAGVYKAPSIKVAEAAKVIENTQRDLNISLMNELAVIFERLNIDTNDVIEAASTKWNFLKFTPGLVGGHCIAVDPYYLTYKAEKEGYIPQVILAGRRVNDNITKVISNTIIKKMIDENVRIKNNSVTIMGITFKENVSDIRNSKVIDLISELKEFGLNINVVDPYANKKEVLEILGIELKNAEEVKDSACVIFAVPHQSFVEKGWSLINSMLTEKSGIVYDIKSSLSRAEKPENVTLFRL